MCFWYFSKNHQLASCTSKLNSSCLFWKGLHNSFNQGCPKFSRQKEIRLTFCERKAYHFMPNWCPMALAKEFYLQSLYRKRLYSSVVKRILIAIHIIFLILKASANSSLINICTMKVLNRLMQLILQYLGIIRIKITGPSKRKRISKSNTFTQHISSTANKLMNSNMNLDKLNILLWNHQIFHS